VSPSEPSRLTTASLTAAEMCGEYSFLVMPFVLAAMMSAFHLSEATAGRLVSLQLLGMTLASALVTFTLRPDRSLRPILAVAAAVIVLANVACALFHAPLVASMARLSTGMGEGAAMAAAAAAVCATANPHKVFSTIGMAGAVFGIIALVVTPYIATHLGPSSVFWMLALLPLPVFPLLSRIPAAAGEASAVATTLSASVLRRAPVLLAYFAFWAGASGLWVYAERIGASQGLTPAQVGLWLSLAQFASTPAPLVSAWAGPRVGMRACIAAACIGMSAAAGFFVFGGRPWTYGLGAFLASSGLLFVVPCFRSRMASLDASGQTVSLSVGAYTIGFGVAPLVVSTISGEGSGYVATGLFCVACFVASAVLAIVQWPEQRAFAS
jgi:predicted MFS family arabinose efflux permease